MDFIVGLSLSTGKFDSIWVIVDRFTKPAHFIPEHTNYRVEKYTELYIGRIMCLHGVPKTIISDRGAQFVVHSGSSCMLPWGHNRSIVQLIICRPMVRWSE
jgi:hypothetical protein